MKRILSLALSCILLAGCAGPGGASQNGKDTDTGEGKKAAPMSCTLSEPVYPEFPQQPQMPDGGDQEALQAYLDALGQYHDALAALRGDNPGLTEEHWKVLNDFAAKSIPPVSYTHLTLPTN